jgi:MFS family permease
MRQLAAIDALRNPVFRRLWFVTMIGGLNVGATITTLGWVVVEQSGSPLLVSLVVVTFQAPQLIAGPVGGVLADRYSRPRLIRLGISGRLVLSLVMASSLFFLPHELAPLFVINLIRALTSGATIPSRRAFMADIVPPRLLTNALALDEFALTMVFIVGPVISGSLLLLVEPGVIFVGLACISVIGIALVPNSPESTGPTGSPAASRPGRTGFNGVSSFFGELFEGFGYIRRSRLLLAITATAFAAEMLAFNYLTLVPVFAKDVFGGGAGLLGALNGTMPIGELLGASLMAAFAARVMRPGRLMVFSIIGTFAVGIPLGASGWLPASLVLLAMVGGLAQIYFVMQSTLLLREAPVEARARVLGTQQVSWGAGALGGLMSGALASATNPHLGIVIPACIGLVIVGIIIVVSPELRSGGRATVVDEQ